MGVWGRSSSPFTGCITSTIMLFTHNCASVRINSRTSHLREMLITAFVNTVHFLLLPVCRGEPHWNCFRSMYSVPGTRRPSERTGIQFTFSRLQTQSRWILNSANNKDLHGQREVQQSTWWCACFTLRPPQPGGFFGVLQFLG